MNPDTASLTGSPVFETQPAVGVVELDRYCSGCGYNLRQQAVRRETATSLLMCKCPECGTFEPANTLTTATRSWFRLFVGVFWMLWLVAWLGLIAGSVSSVTGLAVVSGEIRRNWIEIEHVDMNTLVDNDALKNYRAAENGSNNISPSYYYSSNVLTLRDISDDDYLVAAIFLALAAAIGAVMTTITLVTMPHWRRWGYVCFALGWPAIVIVIFHGFIWRVDYSWRLVTIDYMKWHLAMAISVEGLAIAAGLLAVWLGRPVSRGIVRLIIPPKRRGVFAYLWLVDGKTPPKTV